MQPHDVQEPRRGPGKDPNQRRTTFRLLAVIAALAAALSLNLVQRVL